MFDIGFSELVVIGLVALIVIGPEELPRVARTVGHLMGKLRRYVADVKSDISREMELADLKRMGDEVKEAASEIQNSINDQARALHEEFQQAVAPVEELAKEHIEVPLVESAPEPRVSSPAPDDADGANSASETTVVGKDVVQAQPETPVDETSKLVATDDAPKVHHVDDNQLDLFGNPVERPAGGGKA